jgi:hypothetical protein
MVLIRLLGMETSAFLDDVWLVDSTPIEGAWSRPTVLRSNLCGFATYSYCASHSRYFWGLRLHLLATPQGLPIAFALTRAKADEREVLRDLLEIEPELLDAHPGQVVFADKGYRSAELESFLAEGYAVLARPACKDETLRPGARFLKPRRQIIESVNATLNATLKAQLDLERHGGRTIAGVVVRVVQRLLALTAAIWHNERCAEPILRSLVAYDHG